MLTRVYLVALTLAFVQFAFAAATCSRTYTVKKGDFCDKISQEQSVSTFQLAANNPSIDERCTNLRVGESLCLGTTGEDCSTTHIVKVDDTCLKIASANGLNMTIMRMNNPQLDEACHIYDGQVLCISKTVQVPPMPSGGVPSKSTALPKSAPPPPSPTNTPTPTTSPPSSRSTSSFSFPGVATISPPPSASTGNDVINPHPSSKLATARISPPKPTESDSDDDLPFCDEL